MPMLAGEDCPRLRQIHADVDFTVVVSRPQMAS